MIDELKVQEYAHGAVFEIWLQPRSSQRAIIGVHNGALKIKLTSPPVEGRANKECLQFLASILCVSPSEIKILAGKSSRRKTIFVALPPERVREIIKDLGHGS